MIDFIKKHRTVLVIAAIVLITVVFIVLNYGLGNAPNKTDEQKPVPNQSLDQKEAKNEGNEVIEPSPTPEQIEKEKVPVKAKGIYVTGWTAGTKTRFGQLLEMVNNTELNAMVIDVKDDKGKLSYKSVVPLVNEVGAAVNMVGNIDEVMTLLENNNVYPIARVVCFKDPIVSEKRPELAIKTQEGALWRDRKNNTWLNPYNKDSWEYIIDVSKEAAKKGFKEIQFDYIRFPTDGNVKIIDYGEAANTKTKAEVISEFLAYAKKELEPLGAYVSADIFGIVPVVKNDFEQIGQSLEMVSSDIDYICPMVYPSHYANVVQNGMGQEINKVLYKRPDLEPYGVVYNTLVLTKQRLEESQLKVKVRSYLQDFTASWLGKGNYQKYGAQQVREQIKAVYDAGYEEWILWNPDNRYSEEALIKE